MDIRVSLNHSKDHLAKSLCDSAWWTQFAPDVIALSAWTEAHTSVAPFAARQQLRKPPQVRTERLRRKNCATAPVVAKANIIQPKFTAPSCGTSPTR